MRHIKNMYQANHKTGAIKPVDASQIGVNHVWLTSTTGDKKVLKSSSNMSYHSSVTDASKAIISYQEKVINHAYKVINKVKRPTSKQD